MDPDPRDDQADARLRDLKRLRELLDRYGADGSLHIAQIPEPERSEAQQSSTASAT